MTDLYFSRVTVNPRMLGMKLLQPGSGDASYLHHQILWNLFDEFSDEQRRAANPTNDPNTAPFIFRAEEGHYGQLQFLMLSRLPPSQDFPGLQVETKPWRPILAEGQTLAFSLRANPTVAQILQPQRNKRGKRQDVMTVKRLQLKEKGVTDPNQLKLGMIQAAIDWLSDRQRLERWGISLPVQPNVDSWQQHQSLKVKTASAITFTSVDYQGLLTVENPALFLEQSALGLGRAKRLGCGLILLRRP